MKLDLFRERIPFCFQSGVPSVSHRVCSASCCWFAATTKGSAAALFIAPVDGHIGSSNPIRRENHVLLKFGFYQRTSLKTSFELWTKARRRWTIVYTDESVSFFNDKEDVRCPKVPAPEPDQEKDSKLFMKKKKPIPSGSVQERNLNDLMLEK